MSKFYMNIVAFGASNSSRSINKQFAEFVANTFTNAHVEVLDLNRYELPIYSIDLETKNGIPKDAVAFYDALAHADLIVISLAEHNGSYTAAFKNIFDWTSRYHTNVFENKKIFLLSTSPGRRGGQSVLETALIRFPIHGGKIIGNFSLPFFHQNFKTDIGITDIVLKEQFETVLAQVRSQL